MEEKLLCAAIWYKDYESPVHNVKNIEKGIVLCGYRHGFIMGQFKALTGKRTPSFNHEQGFLTSKNRFVDRVEAREMFIKAGGIPEFSKELYSEDLY